MLCSNAKKKTTTKKQEIIEEVSRPNTVCLRNQGLSKTMFHCILCAQKLTVPRVSDIASYNGALEIQQNQCSFSRMSKC